MGVLDRFRDGSGGQPAVRQVDEGLATDLYDHARENSEMVGIAPYKKSGGLQRGMQLLNSLHDVKTEGRVRTKNVTPGSAFELVYDDDEEILQYRFVPGDDDMRRRIERQLKTYYDDSNITEIEPEFLDMADGQYVAGTRLRLRQDDTFLPIKHFRIDPDHFDTDPYDSITSEMVGAPDRPNADVLVQLMIKPAISNASLDRRNWYHGIGKTVKRLKQSKTGFDYGAVFEQTANAITGGQLEGVSDGTDYTKYREEASNSKAANVVAEQRGKKGFHVDIRVVAVSDSKQEAMSRVEETAGMYRKFYDSSYEQGFTPKFFDSSQLDDFLKQTAGREWTGTDQNIRFSTDTLTGICHVPTDLNTQEINYAMSKSGRGIPPRTPRFDYDTHGLSRAEDDWGDIQMTMFDETGRGEPYWYGYGVKNGIEAGVDSDILDVHQFVGGATGNGKTTFLTNLSSQIMNRGHGALIFDPKGKDADEFLAEVPEGREDDVVFVDLSDETDQYVTFNFLEVPSDADPDSREFASAVEALADDVVAIASQGGGDDNYWGALMNRVTRTLVRGMAKSGKTCTLLDLACCVADSNNLEKFYNWMDEERIHFIRESAERIKEKEDSDLEPLAGRFSQWIENDAVRNLISNRDSTASIQEAVEEGKIVIVKNAKSSGETEKRLFATALIRRAWVAAREATDTEPFYVIADEFDSIVTEESNIHKILSEARAFNFCLTLSCQNPSNQLPEKVANAISNQCQTFISFNPGGDDDAKLIEKQHSRDIGREDLLNMSPYRFFMRTTDSEDMLTHSYKVKGFKPIGETREEKTGSLGRASDVEELKRRSLNQYGTEHLSPEEQQSASHFYGGPGGDDDGSVSLTDDRTHTVLETVFRLEVLSGEDEIQSDRVIDELADQFDDVPKSNIPMLLNSCNSRDLLNVSQDGGDGAVELQPDGYEELFSSGETMNAGGIVHQAAMKRIMEDLIHAGYEASIPAQDGEEQPDLVGEVPMELGGSTLEEARQRVAELKEEYPAVHSVSGERNLAVEFEKATMSKPKQIGHNLRKAVENNDHCLFVVNEDDDFTGLAEKIDRKLSGDMLVYDQPPEDVSRRFHHKSQMELDENGARVAVPGPDVSLQWVEQDGQILLRSGEGEVFAEFSSPEHFEHATKEDFPATYISRDHGVTLRDEARDTLEEYEDIHALREEWTTVYAPFIPEVEFGGELPDSDAWDIAILPDDEDEPLHFYDDGDAVPLVEYAGIGDQPDVEEAGSGDETPGDELSELAEQAGIEL